MPLKWKNLWIFLGACIFFRLCSAYFVYGPQALDDYINTLLRVKKYLAGQDLELAPWRSPLIVWILGFFVKCNEFIVGQFNPTDRIRLIYSFLALISLMGPLGAWFYYSRPNEERSRNWAILFLGFHGLIPFISTRALGESMALPLIALGVGLAEWAGSRRPKFFFLGFLLMGVATLLRFQCGIFYVVYGLAFLWRERRVIKSLVGASLATLLIQSTIDLSLGRFPLETLYNYLLKNQDTSQYGVHPWWSTWLAWAGFLLLPLFFVFLGDFKKFWARHEKALLALLAFLLLHSAVPHKEERFIYPILGVSLILLAWFPARRAFSHWSGGQKIMASLILLLNTIAILATSFQNTQSGVVVPLSQVSKQFQNVRIFDLGSPVADSKIWKVFLSEYSDLVQVENIDAHLIDETFRRSSPIEAVLICAAKPDKVAQLLALSQITSPVFRCTEAQEAGSWIDRLIFKMNPRRNVRRQPNWWMICSLKN